MGTAVCLGVPPGMKPLMTDWLGSSVPEVSEVRVVASSQNSPAGGKAFLLLT